MIKAKQLPRPLRAFVIRFINWGVRISLNKLVIRGTALRPGHSVLLMCNHFGFGDGFLAYYLIWQEIRKKQRLENIYVMSVESQLKTKKWMRYLGCFSIAPGISRIRESLAYAAGLLEKPGNILLFYPQGNLESQHVREIVFQDGLRQLVPQIKGDCQIIWCSTVVEFFEDLRPSVYFNLLDCGTNHDFDFDKAVADVNEFHREAIDQHLRFTGKTAGN